MDFGKEPLKYYQEQYTGLTRGQLQVACRPLYDRLRKEGLLENIPTRK